MESHSIFIEQISKLSIKIYCKLDGISYDYEENILDINILHAKLAGYFDVKEITSVHSDNCDYIGVWIIYKD